MSRLLSDLVPLRKTTVWSVFRTPEVIPHRYGPCSGKLLQYNQARTQFIWADHASEAVLTVYVGGTAVTNWTWRNDIDSTGHPVTIVEFNAPPDQTQDVYASGFGKLNPRTNARVTNPADVIWDLLANVCGMNYPYARFVQFKNACDRLQIIVGGSFEDDTLSIQGQVREIGDSVGATFAPDSFTLLQIWPGGPIGPVRETLDYRFDFSSDCNQSTVVNDYALNFDFLNGNAQQSVQLDVPASVSQYQRKQATYDAKWLHDLRVAYDVAQRYLKHYSRSVHVSTISGIKKPLVIGDFVTLSHPVAPIAGPHMVVARERPLSLDVTNVVIEVPIGPTPGVRLVMSSTAATPLTFASLNLTTEGDQRVITLLNSDGSPIVNAQVTLDNQTTRNTDAGGKVAFSLDLMPAGQHQIDVICQDGRTFSQVITVGNA